MKLHVSRILVVFALLFGVLAATPTGAVAQAGRDFFVSPSGSDNNSGATIDRAVATLQHGAGLIGPGDTLWVLDGTYRGFSRTITGSAAAYARIAAYPGATPLIDAGSGNGAHFVESSYVELWGLEVRGDSGSGDSPSGAGVLMTRDSHHMRIVQNDAN